MWEQGGADSGKKKKEGAHRELSVRGRRSEREQRRTEGLEGGGGGEKGGGGSFSPFQLRRLGSARLDNRGQLKQKEKVMNLALMLFNYRALIVTADQFQGRSRRTKSASCCPAWPEKKGKNKNKTRLVGFSLGDNKDPRELGWK